MKALVATGRPDAMVAMAETAMPQPRPGKDIAGLVVRADGTGPAAGQRAVGHPEAGGWARYATVPTRWLAPIPDSMSAVQAATLPLAGLTALRLLRLRRQTAAPRRRRRGPAHQGFITRDRTRRA